MYKYHRKQEIEGVPISISRTLLRVNSNPTNSKIVRRSIFSVAGLQYTKSKSDVWDKIVEETIIMLLEPSILEVQNDDKVKIAVRAPFHKTASLICSGERINPKKIVEKLKIDRTKPVAFDTVELFVSITKTS